MGARVEGKQKKKGIKANVTSKFSSKRKLSRMGKKVKKGEMGPNTEFITRSAVLKKLQVTLKDFRRLCILKGIYPRVPPKAPKGSDKVYYDIKDISHLAHEPLLDKFRNFKSFMKKVRKASGRNQHEEARRLDDGKAVIRLDHLVKERYPRFIDALRDIDDALCMIHLFASLPSKGRITASRTNLCKELVSQWEYYVIQSRSLHKTFVSVKGVYFQAQVMGEQVTWIAPHPFTQGIPFTVDFRVMITFLDFYEVFMKFVLYKLYNLQGLQYPPVVSDELRKSGCHLYALKALSIDQETNTTTTIIQEAISIPSSNKEKSDITQMEQEIEDIAEDDESVDEEEAELVKENLGDAFSLLHGSINREEMDEGEEVLRSKFGTLSGNEQEDKRQNLFRGMKFFINREVNLEWMQVCICAMGGLVGWEGPQSPYDINCPDITHHVIDRPAVNNGTVKLVSREYIQPQWVFDCINAQMILPVLKYSMGSTLPPHLSPFVDDAKEGYLPKYRQEIMNLLNGEGSATGMEGQEQIEEDVDGEVESDEVEEEDNEEVEGNEENESDEEEDSDAESESEEVDLDDQKKQKGQKAVVVPRKAGNYVESEAIEAKNLSVTMMSKKTKRLYGRMQYGLAKKQEEIDSLTEKRKRMEEKEQNVSEEAKGQIEHKKSKRARK